MMMKAYWILLIGVLINSILSINITESIRSEVGDNVEFACDDASTANNQSLLFSPTDEDVIRWRDIVGQWNRTKGKILLEDVDINNSGLYKCVGLSEKIYKLWVYDLQLRWIFACPSDESARCSADYDQNRMYIMENATVTLGCTSIYYNFHGDVRLDTIVPEHWQTLTANSSQTAVSRSKRWRVHISALDAKKRVECSFTFKNEHGQYEKLAQTSFIIEVRNAKAPTTVLDEYGNLAIANIFTNYYKSIGFGLSALSVLAAAIIILFWRRKRNRKQKTQKSKSRERSNSILLSRSVRDKRFLNAAVTGYSIPAGYASRSRMSSVLNNMQQMDSSDSEEGDRTPPKRPPPRLGYSC